jgi:hypothetical protein
MRVSRLVAGLLIALSVVAGYVFASLVLGPSNSTSLARICARIDYVDELQEALEGKQQTSIEKPRSAVSTSEEVRNEFRMLVAECRAALRERAKESD